MKKQRLSEELLRMKKLAGIIKENAELEDIKTPGVSQEDIENIIKLLETGDTTFMPSLEKAYWNLRNDSLDIDTVYNMFAEAFGDYKIWDFLGNIDDSEENDIPDPEQAMERRFVA